MSSSTGPASTRSEAPAGATIALAGSGGSGVMTAGTRLPAIDRGSLHRFADDNRSPHRVTAHSQRRRHRHLPTP